MSYQKHYTGVIQCYKDFLPIATPGNAISLGEGRTPLVHATRLAHSLDFDGEIYLKFEGTNPTASFKDRGMTVAVTRAREEGAKAVICASTGNTAASAAAYAARAGLASFVLIPEGKIALGKLAQAMLHGAQVIQIRGNFDKGLEIVRELAEAHPLALVNSLNPYRLQGQKTAAFEIIDELGRAPDFHALPVGNAGNITAYWMGYKEYADIRHTHRPHMLGFQATGSAPIVEGHPVTSPDTVATAIRIGNPASWQGALNARDESGGWIEAVSDTQILDAQQTLGSTEGIFCEPASAAAVAGLRANIYAGRLAAGAKVVCTLTGHGLKDPDIAIQHSTEPLTVEATRGAVEEAIRESL